MKLPHGRRAHEGAKPAWRRRSAWLRMHTFRRRHHQEIATVLSDLDATEPRITEPYTKAVEQLGSDEAPVRFGGLYALERLAQDNPAHRQTIVNVICAYLRMPFFRTAPASKPEPEAAEGENEPGTECEALTDGIGGAWQQERQVRLTAQRIIAEHLRDDRSEEQRSTDPPSSHFWNNIRLDLTGATLIDFNLVNGVMADANFHGAAFSGDASFDEVTFGGPARFGGAVFGGAAWFGGAVFGGAAWFARAVFSGDARFGGATFTGDAVFGGATFTADAVFDGATFTGDAHFPEAAFGGNALFGKAAFRGDASFRKAAFRGDASFRKAAFRGDASFRKAAFRGDASFDEAAFGGNAWFDMAAFRGDASFDEAAFTGDAGFGEATFGGDAWFDKATFSRGALFDEATFTGSAWFGEATFTSHAGFDRAAFGGSAWFAEAAFTGDAGFGEATFGGDAWFDMATFCRGVSFDVAAFGGSAWFGEASFRGLAWFGEATFSGGADALHFGQARILSPGASHVWPTGWRLALADGGGYAVVRTNDGGTPLSCPPIDCPSSLNEPSTSRGSHRDYPPGCGSTGVSRWKTRITGGSRTTASHKAPVIHPMQRPVIPQ